MGSERFDGIIGPIFLLLIPLALRKPEPGVKWILGYCAATFLFWATTSQQIRFLSPVLLFLSIVAGWVVSGYGGKTRNLIPLLLVIAVCIGLNVPHIAREYRRIAPLEYLSGREDRTAFLDRTVPPHRAYRYLDEHLPADSRTFLIFLRNLTFLTSRQVYSDYMFESYTLQQVLDTAAGPDDVCRALRARGFTHIAYSESFVLGFDSVLTDGEKALFRKFRDTCLTPLYSNAGFNVAKIRG